MTSIGSPSPFFFGGKKAYEVERSLRFNKGDNPVLTRSPSSTTNSTKQTLSFWFKISSLLTSNNQGIMFAGGSNGSWAYAQFYQGTFYFGNSAGPYWMGNLTLRDFSAWYHAVIVIDTTLSTSNDRQKLYINGVQQERNSGSSDPSQNSNYEFLTNSSWTYYIGKRATNDMNFDGYMAEINFVQGLALDSSYFGETDSITGQWNPKKYVGSYGTNGFYLNFSDNSGTTATTLGKDSSGNGNNWTPSNLAVSDAMKDSPTNNFATMNPLTNYTGLSEGNLRFNFYNDSAGNRSTQATIALPKSGKWYWEARYSESGGAITTKYFGVGQIQMNTGYITAPYVYYDGGSGILRNGNASDNKDGKQVWYNGTGVPAVLAMAVDVDNNSVEYFHNGSSQGTIPLPTLTSSQEYFFTWANTSGGNSANLNDTFNFGADSTFQGQETSGGNTDANGIGDFKYAPPSGHLALCSANLPDSTIKLPNKHFETLTYTGNGSSPRTISGLQFSPDFVWLKHRNSTSWHRLQNSVVGANKLLYSNSTNAEATDESNGHLNSFTSDGFIIDDPNSDGLNNNSGTYVGWNWNGGDTDGKTYTVKVHSFSGNNRYIFDDFQTQAVTLDLAEGGTYIFNMDDASNASHPFSIGTAANGTVYTSGITYFLDGVSKTYNEYTLGFSTASTRRLHITVPASAPVLYYWCSVHSGMGGQVNTNSTLGSSNFDGSIQSTVKVNTTAGFSIVGYTGTGSNATVGHGLGVAPKFIITKQRSTSGHHWRTYHKSIGATKSLYFDLNNAQTGTDAGFMNNTEPTSSVFSIGNDTNINESNQTHIAYCFSEVAGYSKFGSYTGNGNTNGTFVFTGFRPAVVIQKRTDNTGHWYIFDNKRNGFNVDNDSLSPNLSDAEYDVTIIDLLSNGFKLRTNAVAHNGSGGTYIYVAFAESPFKNARAR